MDESVNCDQSKSVSGGTDEENFEPDKGHVDASADAWRRLAHLQWQKN